ncbi:MAG: Endonuclease III [Nitrospira sp.]|jgi:endonuclease-3|nr:MAG: Endonuclease III [Nitrospira sp.]
MRVQKQPFEITSVFRKIRKAIEPFPKAAMFQLAEEGFISPFEQLVACLISVRTRDETTVPTARRLFSIARTPAHVAKLSVERIEQLIHGTSFREVKAVHIREIAIRTVQNYAGVLPCDEAVLRSFTGVGPKCAHLVLGIACGLPAISVDIHVHRVTNRWGFISASTPEQTMMHLEDQLPKRFWIEINRLLVPFGKHICTPTLPKCSACPVLDVCLQVGVTRHR